MKKNIFIFILSLGMFSTYAQDKEKEVDFGFNAGLSIPLSELKSTTYTETESGGFAKAGFNYGIDIRFYFNSTFGLGFQSCFSKYKVDCETWRDRAYEPGIDDALEVEAEDWKSQLLALGPYLKFELKENLFLESHIAIGINNIYAPQIDFHVEQQSTSFIISRPATNDNSLNVGVGCGLNYYLKDQIGIYLKASYQYAKPGFIYNDGGETDHFKFQSININGGVSFLLF